MALPVGAIDPKLISPNPVVVTATGAGPMGPQDAKSQLVQFCQRFAGRPVAKDDIVYTPFKFPTGFQSKVKVNCVDAREFAGEMAATAKDAEQNAAVQALIGYKDQVDNINAASAGKKRKIIIPTIDTPAPAAKVARVGVQGGGGASAAAGTAASFTAKSELNMQVSRIARKQLGKQEITYDTIQVPGGFQSRLTMPCLGGIWAHHPFTGEISSRKMDAEQSVAAV
eukprot:CAMPEP_0197663022 /NCGR_PEP_ID=MMETSP1338-20131121/55819_1 /TAXON_ID=43686 ORGANISM="Pelagodinium beii, Strain RCC1491" /NCGR_SAMPLE_ID=MMETSP1338 /ASSEMBLY_ACC=CAM_ASM_000754 /LENGTH=225 /DNA_ID=CAMNT_0043241193 /DNA_START=59 /DNA_END=733 /DNA_ORIENTATION=+